MAQHNIKKEEEDNEWMNEWKNEWMKEGRNGEDRNLKHVFGKKIFKVFMG